MSDTPETDAYLREMGDSAYCDFSGVGHIDSKFARKLERERDKALRELQEARNTNVNVRKDRGSRVLELKKQVTELEAQIIRIKKSHEETERDEIESMREAIKEAHEALSNICKPLGDETETSGNPCTPPNPEQGRAILKAFAKLKPFLP